jgi:hypothetical protein
MVAQELDQLVSTVLERSTKAMVVTKFLGFVRQHPVQSQMECFVRNDSKIVLAKCICEVVATSMVSCRVV